jgi:hypothetical protein
MQGTSHLEDDGLEVDEAIVQMTARARGRVGELMGWSFILTE